MILCSFQSVVLLMEEIPNNHLECIKPCKKSKKNYQHILIQNSTCAANECSWLMVITMKCVYFKETGPPARWNDQYNSILFCETTMISTLKPFCNETFHPLVNVFLPAFPKGFVFYQGKLRVPTTPCPACDVWYGLRTGRQWDLSSRSIGWFNQLHGVFTGPPPRFGAGRVGLPGGGVIR